MDIGLYKKPPVREPERKEAPQPEPQPQPQIPERTSVRMTHDEYKERYNPVLKEHGLVLVHTQFYGFLKIFAVMSFIALLIGGYYFLHLVEAGKLQSNINPQITSTSNFNATINNEYNFTPVTTNQYTIQLNVTMNMPENLTISTMQVNFGGTNSS